ncbi:MAG: universal stress protein [Nitrospirota bacterium]|nr:universal stress protein [Nitrospirota bacterium]
MRVLLAIDASPDSRNAAGMIKHLAVPPDLHVLNVVDVEALKHAYDSPEMPAGYYETYRQEVSEVAERVLHEMKAELAPHASHIRLIADTGDAAESIIQTAEEARAGLVILGQRGMTATPTFLLGGVSQKVATYAPCSVLIVKEPQPTLDRILLALDGSDESTKAVQFLARAPFKGPMRVTAVLVWPGHHAGLLGPAKGLRDMRSAAKTARAQGEALLRSTVAPLSGKPYEVETEWLQGDPAFSLIEAAARHQAQMIVLGARGMKAVKRFLLGSVSQKVLVHAPCSVLIVR